MDKDKKQIAIWLMSGCVLIFAMVVIGGITRLTGSGLSITEWKPIMGAIPPLNDEEWNIAFEKYKQIPQFELVNSHYSLGDFKKIFFWEWFHRLVGRLIGFVFIVPFFYFFLRKKLDRKMIVRSLILFSLGLLQGFLGWFMVKSGLTELTKVSHYRLAIHLVAAFATFGFTFWFFLDLINENRQRERPMAIKFLKLFFMIIVVQIIWGAFTAGLHAGHASNTWPLMNGELIPTSIANHFSETGFLSFTEDHFSVQFIHRMLAYFVFFFFLWLTFSHYRKGNEAQKKAFQFLSVTIGLQILLGIVTIITDVNITMAALHQAGSFFVFASCIYLMHASKPSLTA